MSKPRKFFKSGYQHICQITADHGLFVYNIIDVIVLLSVLSVHAARRGIAIIALTIMLNHFHLEGKFVSASQMDSYMNGATSAFARMHNAWYGLEGQLFQKPYCNSPKVKDEKIRDTFIYIGKNGVEKKACTHAWDYRFNFLKYLESNHPYSEEINPATASAALISAITTTRRMHDNNEVLGYIYINKVLRSLKEGKERQQFIDYVISLYNPLDKKTILDLYGSIENMKIAFDAVTGSEYFSSDDTNAEDYKHYYKMISILEHSLPKVEAKNRPTFGKFPKDEAEIDPTFGISEGWGENKANLRHDIISSKKFEENPRFNPRNIPRILSEREFAEICRQFRSEVGATDYEIKKFFHLLDA